MLLAVKINDEGPTYAALETEMSFDEFQDGGHLGYGNEISTILNLHVALMPH